jgi:hypothetical protein
MFIETSLPRKPGDTAALNSKSYTATTAGDHCVEFWYHMYGRYTGTLNVYQIGSGAPATLFNLTGKIFSSKTQF